MTDQNIGKKLGNYRIDRFIAEGGMSHVYEGKHEKFERRYAIKVMKPELTIQSSIRWRFENEAKVMDKLHGSKSIIDVYDFYEESNYLAIIMEYLDGETLKARIKRGPMNDASLNNIFPQLFDAFKYAQEKNIVHRDVKPSNIYLLNNGEIRVLDFGIAKMSDSVEDHTATGTQIGTVIYMSPEQVKDSKNIDHRSDIYSLGVVLYHCITGKSPYNTETLSNFTILTKIVNEPLGNLEQIPEPYRSIIERCTAKNPDDRFQSCDEIKRAFQEGKSGHDMLLDDDKTEYIANSSSKNEKTEDKTEYIPSSFVKKEELKKQEIFKKEDQTVFDDILKPQTIKNNKKRNIIIAIVAAVLVLLLFVLMVIWQPWRNRAQERIQKQKIEQARLDSNSRAAAIEKARLDAIAAAKAKAKADSIAAAAAAKKPKVPKTPRPTLKPIQIVKNPTLGKGGKTPTNPGKVNQIGAGGRK